MFANTHPLRYIHRDETTATINCCTPLAGSSLSDAEAGELERLFRVLADRHRVKILNILLRAAGQAVCVCEFTDELGLAQPTVSYHLKQLRRRAARPEKRGHVRLLPGARRCDAASPEPGRAGGSGEDGLSVDAKLARALLAEAVGTFALVFAGCGAIMVDAKTHSLGHVGVAISFGLVIMVMIYAVGHISGAHFNPAVTLRVRVHAALPVAARRPPTGPRSWPARSRRRSSCAARWATSPTSARPCRPARTARRSCGRSC